MWWGAMRIVNSESQRIKARLCEGSAIDSFFRSGFKLTRHSVNVWGMNFMDFSNTVHCGKLQEYHSPIYGKSVFKMVYAVQNYIHEKDSNHLRD